MVLIQFYPNERYPHHPHPNLPPSRGKGFRRHRGLGCFSVQNHCQTSSRCDCPMMVFDWKMTQFFQPPKLLPPWWGKAGACPHESGGWGWPEICLLGRNPIKNHNQANGKKVKFKVFFGTYLSDYSFALFAQIGICHRKKCPFHAGLRNQTRFLSDLANPHEISVYRKLRNYS